MKSEISKVRYFAWHRQLREVQKKQKQGVGQLKQRKVAYQLGKCLDNTFLNKDYSKTINFHSSYALSIDNCLKLNEITKDLI